MSAQGSVTYWLHQLKSGKAAAAQKLWEGYFQRLVGVARARLRRLPRAAADEEDAALSAFETFCRAAEEGRFPRLEDRHDLWQLLVLLTERKVSNQVKRELRGKRGGGRVVCASALADAAADGQPAFADQAGREPEPWFAAQLADQFRYLLECLPRDELRSVVLWKMEGYTNRQIAARLGRTEETVERKLRLIRKVWQKEMAP